MTPHVWVVELWNDITVEWEPIKMCFVRDEARTEHRLLRRFYKASDLRIVKYGRMA